MKYTLILSCNLFLCFFFFSLLFFLLSSPFSSQKDIDLYNYEISYKENTLLYSSYHDSFNYSDSLFSWYWDYFITEHKGTIEEADSIHEIVRIAQNKTKMLSDSLKKSFKKVDSLSNVVWLKQSHLATSEKTNVYDKTK